MKHLNISKSLLALSLLGVMAACSSENAVVRNVKVSDVITSDCKTSLSKEDTRPEYYNDIYRKKTTLNMLMGNDNMIGAQFFDVLDNCQIGRFHVDVSCHDNTIVIILYPELDMVTSCICEYDVDFKIEDLLPGNYQIEVYHTASTKQINSSNRIYEGAVSLESNKAIMLTLVR